MLKEIYIACLGNTVNFFWMGHIWQPNHSYYFLEWICDDVHNRLWSNIWKENVIVVISCDMNVDLFLEFCFEYWNLEYIIFVSKNIGVQRNKIKSYTTTIDNIEHIGEQLQTQKSILVMKEHHG